MIKKYLWTDRKRSFLGLPLSFTRYRLDDEKLIIDTGFFSRREEEIRLYRIMDITLNRSLGERLLGIGTIHCCSGDKTTPEFDIKHVKHPRQVKEMLSDMVEDERLRRRVGTREFMESEFSDGDFDGHID